MIHSHHNEVSTSKIASVSFYAGIAFFSLLSRLILSPLLISIERELDISHATAASFFIFITSGFAFTMFLSGFISERLSHRGTILLSIFATGCSLLLIAWSYSLNVIRIGLVVLGMSCGLYLPSGMSSITGYIHHKHWGKAISIHEIGYNSSFLFSTLLTAVLLHIFSWRSIIVLIGVLSIIMGILFALFGRGGKFPGNHPGFNNLKGIITNRSFWSFVILFSLSAGASLGVFSILPTYLVSEHGMNYRTVNITISLSRTASLPFIFIAGILFDIMNYQLLFGSIIFLTGILTLFLGLAHNDLLIFMIFLQPMIITCFFPIALALFAKTVPKHLYNVAISVMIPISYMFGGGVVPSLIGLMGEYHSFASGIVILGSILVGSTFLIFSISNSSVSEEPVHLSRIEPN